MTELQATELINVLRDICRALNSIGGSLSAIGIWLFFILVFKKCA